MGVKLHWKGYIETHHVMTFRWLEKFYMKQIICCHFLFAALPVIISLSGISQEINKVIRRATYAGIPRQSQAGVCSKIIHTFHWTQVSAVSKHVHVWKRTHLLICTAWLLCAQAHRMCTCWTLPVNNCPSIQHVFTGTDGKLIECNVWTSLLLPWTVWIPSSIAAWWFFMTLNTSYPRQLLRFAQW